jgi:hypothetical protein
VVLNSSRIRVSTGSGSLTLKITFSLLALIGLSGPLIPFIRP